MKDVLERKPSLAELTGISEMRLDCFSAYFREYLLGSTVTSTQANQIATPVTLLDTAVEPSEQDSSFQVSSSSLNISFPQHNSTQTLKVNSFSEDYGYASTIMEVAKISSIDNKKSLEGSKPSSAGLGSLSSNTEWCCSLSFLDMLSWVGSLLDLLFSSFCPLGLCTLSCWAVMFWDAVGPELSLFPLGLCTFSCWAVMFWDAVGPVLSLFPLGLLLFTSSSLLLLPPHRRSSAPVTGVDRKLTGVDFSGDFSDFSGGFFELFRRFFRQIFRIFRRTFSASFSSFLAPSPASFWSLFSAICALLVTAAAYSRLAAIWGVFFYGQAGSSLCSRPSLRGRNRDMSSSKMQPSLQAIVFV